MSHSVNLNLWAKLAQDDSRTAHPLVCHMLDTGFVAGEMWGRLLGRSLRCWLARAFRLDEGDLKRWIQFWSSLHDLGKATPAFQQKARNARPDLLEGLGSAGLSIRRHARDTHHGVLTTALVAEGLAEAPLAAGVDRPLAMRIALVLGGHHGVFRRALQSELGPRTLGGETWQKQRESLVAAMVEQWGILRAGRPSLPSSDADSASILLAGLVSVADWIASCEDFFPYAGTEVDVETYVSSSANAAEEALQHIGWHPAAVPAQKLAFAGSFGFRPNGMQQHVFRALEALTEPAMLILEYPMGHGKTEAAFAGIHDGLRRLGHRGAYLALPTQATSNQMFQRFCRDLGPVLSEGAPAQTQLLHGRAALNEQYLALRPRGDEGQNVVASEWFAASKRGLLAPFGVGTIDQSLLAILQTRHFFVRLFGMAGKVVVLDEVHAYDTYTSTLLEKLVRWLGRLQCSVVLLSATLPAARRRRLVTAYRGGQVREGSAPYPRLTVAAGKQTNLEELPSPEAKTIKLATVGMDPGAVADRLAGFLREGGCAACICNTVDRAQKLYTVLRDRLGGGDCPVFLLHARFPSGQRAQLESGVVDRFGKSAWTDGKRPERAVLVATQVIEQSLDLDFDVMVSELAPVDLILQRAGRLHRHTDSSGRRFPRPAPLDTPQLLLSIPGNDGVPRFGSDEYVYERYVLLKTYLALVEARKESVRIPQDMEPLIEAVYGDQAPNPPDENWKQELIQAKADLESCRNEDAWSARVAAIPDPDAAQGILDAANLELPEEESAIARWGMRGLTRKARPSVQVVCLHQERERAYLDAERTNPADLNTEPDAGMAKQLVARSVTVSRPEVVRALRERPSHRPWRRCPVLRHCYPLSLEDGAIRFGRTVMRLDPELGIVFEKSPIQGDAT